jgi:hypothetical protein
MTTDGMSGGGLQTTPDGQFITYNSSAKRISTIRSHPVREDGAAGSADELMSSRHGLGMEPLFEALANTVGKITKVMNMDYARYGKGEALLGWVNVRVQVRSSS